MKKKIQIECSCCGGTGELGGDIDVAPVDCAICGGLGYIWDYPEDPEFEPEDE